MVDRVGLNVQFDVLFPDKVSYGHFRPFPTIEFMCLWLRSCVPNVPESFFSTVEVFFDCFEVFNWDYFPSSYFTTVF